MQKKDYQIENGTKTPIILYKLLVLDKNSLNLTTICK